MTDNATNELDRAALDYHQYPKPGKIQLVATTQLTNQRDLALAYSPGVAAPCRAIAANPSNSFKYTSRANLVAVISNGSAVLGLGNIGALASKPVMEGKGVLFKKFAGIDVFDIEVDCADPEKLIEVIAALEPTFGGINLEDIKAPDCFIVERALRERLSIPVFHDDQHGTAIVVCAALINGLELVAKPLAEVKLVSSGAGAAAIACLNLLVAMGLPQANITVCDNSGVVYAGRQKGMDEQKAQFAQDTEARTLAEVIGGADVFLGLSVGGVLTTDMVKQMAANPLILALANPTPEILPEDAMAVRPDAVIATGRSDYPNQVNNVLCFPYIFRGALDVRAATINEQMEIAAVHAIASLAKAEESEVVAAAYAGEQLRFGPEYLIPKPFDPRLMIQIAPAVAQAAMDSGVARAPIADIKAYKSQLQELVFASGTMMKPIFAIAQSAPNKKIAFAEGEEERVLRACQIVVDEQIARPVIIGRPAVMQRRIERMGLRMRAGTDYEMINIENDERYREFWQEYQLKMARRGVTKQLARIEMRRRPTLIAAMLLHRGEVDGMICGTWSNTGVHLNYIDSVIGKRAGSNTYACMNGLILPERQLFVADTHVNYDPNAEELTEITLAAAEEVRKFGLQPKVALLSHSNFGSSNSPSASKMRQVLEMVQARAPELEIDGEMHGDAALQESIRSELIPQSTLAGSANLLIMPNIDSANIAYNLLKSSAGGGIAIGPILLGVAKPAHILTPSTTVRRIVNMAAVTVADIVAMQQ